MPPTDGYNFPQIFNVRINPTSLISFEGLGRKYDKIDRKTALLSYLQEWSLTEEEEEEEVNTMGQKIRYFLDKINMCMLICIHMLTKRTNILFDNETWLKLQRLAKNRSESVGELVRQAVAEKYQNDDKTERIQKAHEWIMANRKVSRGKIDYKALINYGRKF